MIPRYSRSKMVNIWEQENKIQIWLDIERYACEAQENLGVIPKGVASQIEKYATFDVKRIDEIEKDVKHDVIAFLTNIAETVGEKARFIHQGMTSSDVVDTCFSIQLMQATDILITDMERLLKALRTRAYEHKNTVCIGRSHGIHAEPTTFGLKLASFYSEFYRNYMRLLDAKNEISICAISGAVGTFANIDTEVEAHVARKFGLQAEPISTQVIPRDRYAMYFSVLGVIASSIERLAIEIRHLQRTEVREAQEAFSNKQKGSSAMPHKKNPILTENLTGLARMIRSAVIPAMEDVALWHERDISHSSVERFIGPDATITLDFALNRLANVVENLVIREDRMMANLLSSKYLFNSQRVLLELTQRGMSREEAYRAIQKCSMEAWDDQTGKHLYDFLEKDDKVVSLIPKDELLALVTDLDYHLKNVDTIFSRVFNKL